MMAATVLLVSVAHGQKQWTLNDCIDYAMQNNITLKKSRLQRLSTSEDVKQSKAALLPSLSASTNQSLGYRPWQDSGTTTVTNGTVNTKVNKAYYNGSYGLNASWTVWNGGRNTNQVKQNELSEQQAELNEAETANSIQEKIAQLYVQILYLSEAVNVDKASLETSQKNEDRGREMVEVGKMSKADLAMLSSQRASDEYAIIEAQSQLATYKLQLKQLLEITDDQPFEIVSPDATDGQALAEIPSLMAVYEEALATRPEMQSAQLTVKSSDLSIDIAKAGNGSYIHVNNSSNAQKLLEEELGKLQRGEFNVTSDYDDQYQAVGVIVLLLLILEICIQERKNPKLKNLKLFKK